MIKNQIHPNIIRQVFFLIILLSLTILIIKQLYFLLAAFLGAITMYEILRSVFYKLVTKYKMKKGIAATLLIIVCIIIIFVPLYLIFNLLIHKAIPLIQNQQELISLIKKLSDYIKNYLPINILNDENLKKLTNFIGVMAKQLIESTFSTFTTFGFMLFFLYFFLYNSFEIEKWLRNTIPFTMSNTQKVLNETRNLIFSNAIGIPIVALLQGIVGLIGYGLFGIKEFVLFGILTAFASVIPIVGCMIVFLPLMLYQLSLGNTWQGVAIGIWGFVIIGLVDNVARFIIAKKLADVHPLITILGVIIGINLFGFLGIIFGPLLLSLLLLMIKIYINEFGKANADDIDEIIKN